jgi:hypothetical protein
MDFVLLSTILFKHYLENELWIFGTIIPIIIFILNIIYIILFVIKYKDIKLLLHFSFIAISIILLFNNIDDKIALKIELNKAKNKLEKIIKEKNYVNKGIYEENGLYAFIYKSGVVDNWTAIVYDNSGILENGIDIIKNNKKYMEIEDYYKIKKLFGGDLYSIKKLEEKWYLCIFT